MRNYWLFREAEGVAVLISVDTKLERGNLQLQHLPRLSHRSSVLGMLDPPTNCHLKYHGVLVGLAAYRALRLASSVEEALTVLFGWPGHSAVFVKKTWVSCRQLLLSFSRRFWLTP